MTTSRTAVVLWVVAMYSGITIAGPNDLDQFKLTFEGLGPLKIGMSVQEVKNAGFQIQMDQNTDPNQCAQAALGKRQHLKLMFESGRISRIEVHGGKFATLSGARIGNTEGQVSRIYRGRVASSPHKYDPNGHYLSVFSVDRKHALVMETDGRVVTDIYVGLADSAHYIEGCL